jgi:pimeloyl-ACP methyl ester carboxylesterase
MTKMRQHTVQCLSPAGFHDMAYVEWGDPDNPCVLVCAHGLTRCGRDFDFVAQALADVYRVVCPDVVGRGRSAWLRDKRHYAIPQYCADMTALLARLDARTVHWLGTSMGGLIGMALAAQEGTPISRLVLNDVGPVVTAASIARIGEFVGKAPGFATLDEAEAYIRFVSAPFGALSDEQWRHLTVHVVRALPGGGYAMAYDPGIAEPFRQDMGGGKDVELWPVYDAIKCPTLLVRGAKSDLLTVATAREMTERGPRARLVEIPDVGHAPTLMSAEQIAVVRGFLLG